MASSGRKMGIIKTTQQDHQQPLNCPRCDSSNTKFCYYNNYSLSQPRHFCKACKRYWTRGGTLRNVPVGGGCRKNKKVIKKTSASFIDNTPTLPSSNQIGVTLSSSDVNPLFHGLFNNQSDTSFSFPSFHSRETNNGYDLESQFNAFRTGISSMSMTSTTGELGENYKPITQIHDVITSNSHVPTFSMIGSSSSNTSSTASLIASSLDNLKQTKPTNLYHGFFPSKDLIGGCGGTVNAMKEAKVEEQSNPMCNKEKFSAPCIETMGSFDFPVNWNSMNVGAWSDLSNYGSSVTSLI